MPNLVEIKDHELVGFSEQAKLDFIASISDHKKELLAEIGRIETGQNSGSGNPEITSTMVKEAEKLFSRGSLFKSTKRISAVWRIVSVISVLATGLLFDVAKMTEIIHVLLFIGCLLLAVLSTTMAYVRD
ncbi:hypothetical protein [Parasphingorhabdus sp.]|uniref:hypothetical protein n=1 Tax=Parasphingorhabdus sp. TaxID=2709688 RepID=UPI002F92E353